MINIDFITIVASIVLILLALLTPFVNPFFRKGKNITKEKSFKEESITREDTKNEIVTEEYIAASSDATIEESILAKEANEPIERGEKAFELAENRKDLPPISIVLTPDDNAEALSDNLSLYLAQDYPADFQVIVVAPKKDKETEDILKQHTSNRLYITFIPDSSRYMSKKKLAITLGVKAAKYNWVLMADIFCKPQNDQWLTDMASNIEEFKDIIVGNTVYEEDTPDFQKFERFQKTLYLLREYRRNKAYRCEANALLFKKDMFLANEGFRGNLKFIRGEFDFMVNKYAKGGNLKLADTPEAILIEPAPTERAWRNKHLYYIESRKHLQHSFAHRFLFDIDQFALHFNYLLILACSIFAGITQRWILLSAAVIALIITFSLRISIFKKVLRCYPISLPSWKVLPYEVRIIWHNLKFMNAYRKADKYDFISHKL